MIGGFARRNRRETCERFLWEGLGSGGERSVQECARNKDEGLKIKCGTKAQNVRGRPSLVQP
jgi:hypothetical protein